MGFYVGGDPEPRPRRTDRLALLILVPLLVMFVGLVSVLYITHTTARVDGESMLPSLRPEDILLVTKGYERPLRGDVVVISAPDHPRVEPGSELVKRVIAIPGDEVEVVQGLAYVNGQPEVGTYSTIVIPGDRSLPPTTIAPGQVLLLGDNRPVSVDGRMFGPVDLSTVIGRVDWVIAPINRFRRVD